jgi:hypothetical protein
MILADDPWPFPFTRASAREVPRHRAPRLAARHPDHDTGPPDPEGDQPDRVAGRGAPEPDDEAAGARPAWVAPAAHHVGAGGGDPVRTRSTGSPSGATCRTCRATSSSSSRLPGQARPAVQPDAVRARSAPRAHRLRLEHRPDPGGGGRPDQPRDPAHGGRARARRDAHGQARAEEVHRAPLHEDQGRERLDAGQEVHEQRPRGRLRSPRRGRLWSPAHARRQAGPGSSSCSEQPDRPRRAR